MDDWNQKRLDTFAGYALAAFMLANAIAAMVADEERRAAIDNALAALERNTAKDAALSPELRPIFDAARQHLEMVLKIGP